MVATKFKELSKLQRDLLTYFTISGGGTTSGLGVSCFNSEFPIVHPKEIHGSLLKLVESGYLRATSDNMDGVAFTEDGYHECQVVLRKTIKLHKFKAWVKRIIGSNLEKILLAVVSAVIAGSVTYYFATLSNENSLKTSNETQVKGTNKPNN